MTPLNSEQKQLIFDYCIGLTSERETAEDLIASHKEAAQIHSKLKAALSPLETLEPDCCPDELVEGTVWRLNNLARSSQLRLQQLLAGEQARDTAAKGRPWRYLGRIAAVAAVILIVLGTWFAPLDFARQKSRQLRCQRQLAAGIFKGLSNYISDHDGRMPAVATTANAPWWKVGDQGRENQSATRNMWLLVRDNYVNPTDFVCPGRKQDLVIEFRPAQVKNYNDFHSRKYIRYSVRIGCVKSQGTQRGVRRVLMADLSPLFENLPADYSRPFRLKLDKDLLTLNSINHNRRGQNVLFRDGGVKFIKKRHADTSKDDIFTLQYMSVGCEVRGCERPSSETDNFLAP